MKLITKSIVYYLLIGLPLLVLAGALSYYSISTEVRDGINESLEREKQNAIRLAGELHPATRFYLSADSLSYIEPWPAFKANGCSSRDSLLFNRSEKSMDTYRLLSCYYTHAGTTYLVTIARPLFEQDELVEGLLFSLLLILVFLVIAFFIVNWLLSKTLWKPFNKTLDALGQYKLAQHAVLSFENTNIHEFRLLNEELNQMTEKIRQDYLQQKEFTENASHELQTPLAIIKAALDNLFQSTQLEEKELNQLQSIEKAVSRLSSLNKALLLLTKIENNQFGETQELQPAALIDQLADDYAGLYESKHISLQKNISAARPMQINPVLAELLVGNLIKNAFKHSTANGHIHIELSDSCLSISNTGSPMHLSASELFGRFVKNDAASESLGLGLAIVKSIVTLYNYSIAYEYKNGSHYFILNYH